MKNVFDIKRFGKYFTYDLNNAWSNFGVSALVSGLLPLVFLVFFVVFGLIFDGRASEIPYEVKFIIPIVILVILILSAPVKLYGSLTERKAGSDWLMIPASSFEKFLSMALMLCVVLPVVVFGLFSLCDLLLGWLVPVYYGGSFVKSTASWLSNLSGDLITVNGVPSTGITPGGLLAMVFMSWCASILPFGLGAVCFKKGKAAKTILCIFALEMVLSILLVLVFKGGYDSGYSFGQFLSRFFGEMTAGKMQFLANFIINLNFLIVVGGLLTALFFRIKTLKH